MTYELVYTNSFKKDLKLAQKGNYDMNKMNLEKIYIEAGFRLVEIKLAGRAKWSVEK